jgi:hypothetical protein
MTDILAALGIALCGGIAVAVILIVILPLFDHVFRSKAVSAALEAFAERFPDQKAGFTSKTKDEGKVIVMVAYGTSRPPRRAYFAVDLISNEVAYIKNDAKYRPRSDR